MAPDHPLRFSLPEGLPSIKDDSYRSTSDSNVGCSDDDDDDDDEQTTSEATVSNRIQDNTVQRASTLWVSATFLLAGVALAFSFTVAFVSLDWETSSTAAYFVIDANKVHGYIGTKGHHNLDAIATLGTTIASSAMAMKQEWPFVTVPNFQQHGATMVDTLETLQVLFCPVVSDTDREDWENFSNGFVEKGLSPVIFGFDEEQGGKVPETMPGPFTPIWEISPTSSSAFKFNLRSLESAAQAIDQALQDRAAVISPAISNEDLEIASHIGLLSFEDAEDKEPVSLIVFPVFDNFESNEIAVGILVAPFLWKTILSNTYSQGIRGVDIVFENACGDVFTYVVNDKEATYKGRGDLHTKYYDDLKKSRKLSEVLKLAGFDKTPSGATYSSGACEFTLHTYPSAVYVNQHRSNHAVMSTLITLVSFLIVFVLFFIYVSFIQSQIESQTSKAAQTKKLINALFPKEVQDRMFKTLGEEEKEALLHGEGHDPFSKVKAFLTEGQTKDEDVPIADLWTDCTVMFADIKGFTAWSACRSPPEVFRLLENLYGEFDKSAKRRGVFKVETIGDSYVAVTGLPNPCKDHALVMTKFAYDCNTIMKDLTKQLEVTLGPDTGDLELRIGLHSGPVTAGVLRGDKGRFQLFGDTVNTAARMESTGEASRIQISEATAKLLIAAGKEHWCIKRTHLIEAKGKGKMQTYFAEPKSSPGSLAGRSVSNSANSERADEIQKITVAAQPAGIETTKAMRLVDWNVEMLSKFLLKIIHRREKSHDLLCQKALTTSAVDEGRSGEGMLDEIQEVVPLLNYKDAGFSPEGSLSPDVTEQLREYVRMVCSMYRNTNPFHNFEHASHVTMSVVKLIQRVVAPGTNDGSDEKDHSYGISHDPLAQFACVFSALIHDVDHPGVPNSQLLKEHSPLAAAYQNKSIAEQNSVDLAWELLQQDLFKDLRDAICSTEQERLHFRQLIVNVTLATDIMDKDWKAMREARWGKAFGESNSDSSTENMNRKATIVIEHMIQASDVAHTMQHWHIFRKWNERLFFEMQKAFEEGRAEKNPAETWYEGEIGFFDFYIIPLAKKLSDCGVFGVSSAEYLSYAQANRDEWVQRGQSVVQELVEKAKTMKFK